MHLRLEFELTFESDWHINAGYGMPGKADAVIERDLQGQPIISGATLKGVFRDALHDLARNLQLDPQEIAAILGRRGKDSVWRFSAASPQSSTARASLSATGVRVDPRFRRAEDNKFYVRELGAAESYLFEVVGKPEGSEAQKHVEWLVAAAAYIQRLGGRRRRGTGACHIRLRDEQQQRQLLNQFAVRQCGEPGQIDPGILDALRNDPTAVYRSSAPQNPSHRYQILLKTVRPVIIARKPEAGNVYQGLTYIPGQTLRGALAELAHPGELQASDYSIFTKLFILGDMRFSNLNPLVVEDGIGCPTALLPLGLQRVEGRDDRHTSVFKEVTKQKAVSGWARLHKDGGKWSPETESHPHVAIDPLLKRASDGDLFTYEAIPAGQFFVGEIYLADNDWNRAGQLLNINLEKPFQLLLGKGRQRSYGVCEAVITALDVAQPPSWIHLPLKMRLDATPQHELLMTLATDTILQDDWGRFYQCFDRAWLEPLFGDGVRLQADWGEADKEYDPDQPLPEQVIRTRVIDGFDARSGLPRWRDQALIAGSTARLIFDGTRPRDSVLQRLENEGIGLRRGEGYGRVVFNHPAHTYQREGFAKPLPLPLEFITPQKSSSEQAFTQEWRTYLQEKRQDMPHLWSKPYTPAARSVAFQMRQMLSLKPENLLTTLNVEPDKQAKESLQHYQELSAVAYFLLNDLLEKRPEHWRKGVVLLAEALLRDREITNAER